MSVQNQSIEAYINTLSPNRQILASKLMDRAWFIATDFEIQKEILELPNEYEGFIYNLSERPDSIGSLTINKLLKIAKGNYLVTPVFEVYSKTTQKTFTKEYVTWKMGNYPGIKGTLFIETEGKISHFLTIETDKFAVGENSFDSIGGLFQYSKEKAVDLPNQLQKAIKNKLGLEEIIIKDFIDLGRIQSDNGLTANHPGIFAAVIDGDSAQNLKSLHQKSNSFDADVYHIQIIPINELPYYISKIDDAFFLATVCRLLAKHVVSL